MCCTDYCCADGHGDNCSVGGRYSGDGVKHDADRGCVIGVSGSGAAHDESDCSGDHSSTGYGCGNGVAVANVERCRLC